MRLGDLPLYLATGVVFLLVLARFLRTRVPALQNLSHDARRWFMLRRDSRAAMATVKTLTAIDVVFHDRKGRRRDEVAYHVVLLFTPAGGAPVAVDTELMLTRPQLDHLLPDTEVPIRYSPRDPELFVIDFAAIGLAAPDKTP